MRNYIMMLAMTTTLISGMDADWFYNPECPYKSANELYQDRQWNQAEQEYQKLLAQDEGTERDQAMARVNLATCQMAQRGELANWKAFDRVCSDPNAEMQLPDESDKSTMLVRTDSVGIGDIAHFLPAVSVLKRCDGVKKVLLALRSFLHAPFTKTAQQLGVELIDEKDRELISSADRTTHLMALLGHLNIYPSRLRLRDPLLTADQKAVARVKSSLDAKLNNNKEMCVVFMGENRAATLMGGKQLPRRAGVHGRQLTASAFEPLLQDEPDLILVDCNPSKSAIRFDDEGEEHLRMSAEFKDRVMQLPAEETPFDTTIALAHVMNVDYPNAVGFAADNGPANMFARALNQDAQCRFAYLIPNPQEYDARMEGPPGRGESYIQMLSYCHVYKCSSPAAQAEVIEKALDDMLD